MPLLLLTREEGVWLYQPVKPTLLLTPYPHIFWCVFAKSRHGFQMPYVLRFLNGGIVDHQCFNFSQNQTDYSYSIPALQVLSVYPRWHPSGGHIPVIGSHGWLIQWQVREHLFPNIPDVHAKNNNRKIQYFDKLLKNKDDMYKI